MLNKLLRKLQPQILTYKIKKMILQFANNVQEHLLLTYHITINFKTIEKNPTFYRLELLAKLRSSLELAYLETQILSIAIGENFNLINVSSQEVKTQYERKKIEDNFKDINKKAVSMKFLFRHWVTDQYGKLCFVNDTTVEKTAKKDYRVNILKSGEIPFSQYKDLFCVEINTTQLSNNNQ